MSECYANNFGMPHVWREVPQPRAGTCPVIDNDAPPPPRKIVAKCIYCGEVMENKHG